MNKVAVITRTKDRALLLERAIKSVHAQTYTDYIHVIVNDGGDKKLVDELILKQPAAVRDKIKVFHRESSSGAPDTIFNESIDRVDSEYVAVHDDDDTWHPEFLATTVVHLDENKSKAAVVVRTNKIIEEVVDGQILKKKETTWMPDIKVINLYRQCIDNQFTPIATLFRRSAYDAVGKFDDTLPVVGDWEFGIRLLMKYDADFIDPGYALANYHHRDRIGSSQDAVSNDDKHRYYTNLVMNKYLRSELEKGNLGVGYIMSKLRYDQSSLAGMVKRVIPSKIFKLIKSRTQY